MKTLIIDTSSEYCILALYQEDCIVQQDLFLHENRLSQSLLSRIHELLQRAQCSLNEIERIAVGVGPGSYTGTRIGVAVAKSLSYGLQIPIRGFCSLVAFLPSAFGRLASILPAKSGHFFLLAGTRAKKHLHIDQAHLVSLDELKATLQEIDCMTFRNANEPCNDLAINRICESHPSLCPWLPNPENIAQALQIPPIFPFETEVQLLYLHEHI